jgi:uncharacterized protein (DUF58 family)
MTPLGRNVLLVGLLTWLGAMLLGWEELAVVAGVCLSGLVVALAFTFGTTQLDVRLWLDPARVPVGATAAASFEVTNTASRRMLPVVLEVPVDHAVAVIRVPSLASGETFEQTISIATSRRSVLRVGPTRSVRGDPLALMRREVIWAEAHELFVHPRTTPLQGVSSGWLRDLEGRPTNDRSPNDVAFHTLREYVPGDDRRHIHWRSSARTETLMVREFVDNRRSHLGIVVDTNPASYSDAEQFELAVSIAASLGLRAIADGQETSCVAGSAGVGAHSGQALLDGLSRVELGVPAISVPETAMRAASMLQSASVVALVSGSAVPAGSLSLAAQRFGADAQVLAIRATDGATSLDRHPPMITIAADSLDTFARAMWTVAGQ